jgi:hypothetical protein
LRNVLERAVILADGGVIGPEHLAVQALPPGAVRLRAPSPGW